MYSQLGNHRRTPSNTQSGISIRSPLRSSPWFLVTKCRYRNFLFFEFLPFTSFRSGPHYYGTPLVVEDNGGEKRKFFISPNTTKTCKCGKTDHQRTTHKSCVLNKQNIIEAATLAAATRETDGDKAGK
jgi:hypothetical protein